LKVSCYNFGLLDKSKNISRFICAQCVRVICITLATSTFTRASYASQTE